MVIAYNGKKKSEGNKLRLSKLYSKQTALFTPDDESAESDSFEDEDEDSDDED